MFTAVQVVGEALFGEAWTGKELHSLYWYEQPAIAEKNRKDAQDRAIAHRISPSLAALSGGTVIGKIPTAQFNDLEEKGPRRSHQELVDDEQKLWELNLHALGRLNRAAEWLVAKCRDGLISGFYRWAVGGRLEPMEPHDWNGESVLHLFISDAGNKRFFPNVSPPASYPVYTFVGRESLLAAIATLQHCTAVVSEYDLSRLSPYLRFAVKFALKMGYLAEDRCETEDIRKADISSEWESAFPGVPMTQTQIQMLSSVMAWPNPKAISQGLQGAKAKKGLYPKKAG